MTVLLVTFELNPGRNEEEVRSFIERYDAMRFSPTSYAVSTERSPETIYQELKQHLGRDDLAYVATLSKPWIGYGYEAMNDWLTRHL